MKPSDLESLAPIKRRSPYEQDPPITVYWRKDVEAKAIQIWGSRESFLKECLKREIDKKKQQQSKYISSENEKFILIFKYLSDMFTVRRRIRDYRRKIGSITPEVKNESGLLSDSGRVVLIAITM
jgi:CRISPR/Cas system-associated protein Csx1